MMSGSRLLLGRRARMSDPCVYIVLYHSIDYFKVSYTIYYHRPYYTSKDSYVCVVFGTPETSPQIQTSALWFGDLWKGASELRKPGSLREPSGGFRSRPHCDGSPSYGAPSRIP